MSVNAAEASSAVGLTDQSGRIPAEQFGQDAPTVTTPQDTLGSSPTALDQYYQQQRDQQQAQYMASLQPNSVGGLPADTGTGVGSKIVQAAEHYLGTPYKWGGTGPNGVDCSGLVQMAYKAAGINLPRISFQQARDGTRVNSMKQLRPGDLVAWDNSPRNPGADHIAVYIGGGKIIEAPHPGAFVQVRSLGTNEGAWFIRMGW